MKLPITLCLFTTTKGHHKRGFTDCRITLNHLDAQLPLSLFAAKVASLKITPGDEALGGQMADELSVRGFKVLTEVAAWQRGTSHQQAYNEDIQRISRDPLVHAQPYVWWVEDDGLLDCHGCTLERLLADSARMLAENADLLTVRLRRRADDRGPEAGPQTDTRFFWSQHFNFQPSILRTRDFQLAALFIERNPHLAAQVQIEALWRMVLGNFTRSPLCHAVWECDHAESIHIGVPQAEHEAALRQLGLTPLPTLPHA